MSNAFALDTVVVRTSGSVSANLGGEEVLLNLETGVYYGLNEVGAKIWSLIEQPCPVGKIHEAILAEYDVKPDQCIADMQALLANLSEANLIEVRNA